MKLLTTALLSASVLAFVTPVASAQAQRANDCEANRQGRQVAGAIIGGILGAVIGNELADDSNNQPNYRRGGRGHHDRYGRGGYRGDRYGRGYRTDRGNAEEVGTLAGAGVGALVGAGIAGGDDCGRTRNANTYNPYPGKPQADGYGQPAYQQGYGQDQGYGSANGYGNGYDNGYDAGYGYTDGYDTRSSGELLGAAQPGQDARVYTATSQDWNCQWTSTRRLDAYGQSIMDQVYMCQGADNIWRPYDTYTQN
tara:strand:+ start:18932 stop:19690 length:759 start_codon:yes stop_codon:yes gene_type:complete